MYSQKEISRELKRQVDSACDQFIERLQLIHSAFLSGSTFIPYVKMLDLLRTKDSKDIEQGKSIIEKLLNETDCSERKKELFMEYYKYASSYLFPDKNVLDEMRAMIVHGMAWFCYPFKFKGCYQEERVKYSQNYYKMPENSDLEEAAKKATKEFLQYEFKNADGDFFLASENDELSDILASPLGSIDDIDDGNED